jgi:hypothetical protein
VDGVQPQAAPFEVQKESPGMTRQHCCSEVQTVVPQLISLAAVLPEVLASRPVS